jgi:hypothetical protein
MAFLRNTITVLALAAAGVKGQVQPWPGVGAQRARASVGQTSGTLRAAPRARARAAQRRATQKRAVQDLRRRLRLEHPA